MTARVEALAVTGIGEVAAGDDVATLLTAALAAHGPALRDGDLLVVSSKILSKAEGRAVTADSRDAAVASQSVRVVAERVTPRGLTRIVQSASGPVLAAAGVDNSNVSPGTVLLLPADPDASARALRQRLRDLTGLRLGVVVSDTLGRPWRDGQVDAAIGAAGVLVVEDLRGGVDGYGNPLEVTVRAVADEVAALADLVKGKLDGVPAAVVRGLAHLVTDDDGPGAAVLLRSASQDWFRYGHVEAVRAALGLDPSLDPGADPGGVPPQPVVAGSVVDRVARAVAVALVAPDPFGGEAQVVDVVPTGRGVEVAVRAAAGDELALGALVQRIVAAAWTEDLTCTVDASGHPPSGVAVRLCLTPV